MLNLLPSSMMVVRGTRTAWLARLAVQDELETRASTPFAQLALGTIGPQEIKLSDGSPAELTVTISTVDGHPERLLKRISVDLSWQGRAVRRTCHQEIHVHALRR